MSDSSEVIFVSHAGPDGQWAEWVAWHLQEAGYEVELDLWHWRTGDDFVKKMNEALKRCSAAVALLSPAYFAPGRYTEEEWTALVARRDRFIPVVVEPLQQDHLPAVLTPRLRKDLHDLDEADALAALLEAVRGPALPTRKPDFPGKRTAKSRSRRRKAPVGPQPRFPSDTSDPEVWDVRQRRRNPHFTGRDVVIEEVRRKLLAERQAAVQALNGTGGIGKTQVALEYVYRFAGQYDLVWWVDAEQGEQVPARYAELAARVGVAKPDAGVEVNARYAMEYLRTHDRWLIVLDNAEDPQQLRTWLPEGQGHVLITARNPDWRKVVPRLQLGVFSRAESLDYLTAQLPTLNPEHADALADALGDLPLALAQAAGVMSEGMPPEQYVRVLQTHTAKLLDRGEVYDYPASLAATVTIATDRLDADHPEATAVLRLAAFLGPERIPTAWLVAGRAELTTVPTDPDDVLWPQSALNPLARYGLAVVGPDAFQVHRLTQAVVRDRTGSEATGALRDDVAVLLTALDPGDPELPETWPGWTTLTPHLTATLHFTSDRAELRPMLLRAAVYLVRSAQPHVARDLATTLREAWAASLCEDHPDTLRAAHMVTWALDGMWAHEEALPLVQNVLERRRRVLGDDDPETLSSAHDLAVTLGHLGRNAEAYMLHEDLLATRRAKLGEDHPDTLASAHGCGGTLAELGRHDEARRTLTDVLERRRKVLGDDHPATFHTEVNVAVVQGRLGRHDEARRALTDILERRRKVLGNDHRDTFISARFLASALFYLGRYSEAERLQKSTRLRVRETLGVDHPLHGRLTGDLIETLQAQGKTHEAQKLTKKARHH
ncbi:MULTISPECIES: FxSxx-COOH system tetratricopeptide repeat protein [unclassified Streptomyces]|uniref:FxSxx-COOH system tetratricopeptide repeat protein n=1 Tax=unclassified Streptomyces TaxID=2593676 RepID=UPI0023654DD2|nr:MULTISPECIES: FxSxx-COOH system tetratricopeptide repeat protein [unclassified Streptomyces]MDF3141033.1 FxSxx-COOH system tetratricopeptide repeat protein [Streptomyces sp. T21Q-yed]WDF39251.1 FxSxx-COOH system tetratricopeptide repeat protein [Streptomyces sp. T12]